MAWPVSENLCTHITLYYSSISSVIQYKTIRRVCEALALFFGGPLGEGLLIRLSKAFPKNSNNRYIYPTNKKTLYKTENDFPNSQSRTVVWSLGFCSSFFLPSLFISCRRVTRTSAPPPTLKNKIGEWSVKRQKIPSHFRVKSWNIPPALAINLLTIPKIKNVVELIF